MSCPATFSVIVFFVIEHILAQRIIRVKIFSRGEIAVGGLKRRVLCYNKANDRWTGEKGMFYTLGSELQTVSHDPQPPWREQLIILTVREFGALLSPDERLTFRLPDTRNIRYCKADIEDGRLTGTIARPHQTSQKQKAALFLPLWRQSLLAGRPWLLPAGGGAACGK